MKALSKTEVQAVSGSISIGSKFYIATAVTLYAFIGYVLVTCTRSATKEEEEFYFIMQQMQGFDK